MSSLAGRGLVEKRAASADGRVVELHPTEAADDNLRRLRAEWTELLTDAARQSNVSGPLEETIDLLTGLLDGIATRRHDVR